MGLVECKTKLDFEYSKETWKTRTRLLFSHFWTVNHCKEIVITIFAHAFLMEYITLRSKLNIFSCKSNETNQRKKLGWSLFSRIKMALSIWYLILYIIIKHALTQLSFKYYSLVKLFKKYNINYRFITTTQEGQKTIFNLTYTRKSH